MATLSTNFPLEAINAPSYVSISDPRIQSGWMGTDVVFNESIFGAFLDLHAESVPQLFEYCAETIVSFVDKNSSVGGIGPCSSYELDEGTLSGLFAGLLQHLFSTHLSSGTEPGYIFEILVSTMQNVRKGNSGITMYKVTDSGLHPRLVWNFSINRKAKEGDLFTCTNNMDAFLNHDYQTMTIGVIVVMERDRPPQFQVHGFVKMLSTTQTLSTNSAVSKPLLGMCLLYKGDWDVHGLSRLLFCIQRWMQLLMSSFALPAAGALRDRPNASRTVLKRSLCGVEWIYKVFDARQKLSARSRHHQPSLQFLHGCELVLHIGAVAVIRYPFLYGPHLPQSSTGTVRVLRHLAQLHRESYLHCDIHASNLIFGESGSVIDFDFCAPVGHAVYPDGYNIDIVDGARAPRVVKLMQQGCHSDDARRRWQMTVSLWQLSCVWCSRWRSPRGTSGISGVPLLLTAISTMWQQRFRRLGT